MIFDIIPVTSPRPTDCGATCLKMLLSYYGQEADLNALIAECNTRIVGCSGKDLLRVGRAHGMDLMAWKVDAEDLFNDDRPQIIWWMYNHWVVFGGLDDAGKVVIYNPDKGRYRVSKGVFKSFFTNVALSNGEPQPIDGAVPDEV